MNLILQQNANRSNSVGQYDTGRDVNIEERYTYWRYRSQGNASDSHKETDGKFFRKNAPVWNSIFLFRDFAVIIGTKVLAMKIYQKEKIKRQRQAKKRACNNH